MKSVLFPIVVLLLFLGGLIVGCDNPSGSDSNNDPVPGDEGGEPELRVTIGGEAVEHQQWTTVFVPIGGTVDTVITIHNDGIGQMVFTGITLRSEGFPGGDQEDLTADDEPDVGMFHWVSLPSIATLAAGDSRSVTVRIRNDPDETDSTGEVMIESNDAVNPSFLVLLAAVMQDGGPP